METNSRNTLNRPSIRWLEWAREIQAISQTGIYYSNNEYQRARNMRLQEISAEMISAQSNLNYDELFEIFTDQRGYATPRVDVRGAVFRSGKLLMVREVLDGGWTMPGGWADVGDYPSQAVEREILEETGFNADAQRVIGIYDANRVQPLDLFHAYKIVFLCEITGGKAQLSNETSEIGFFGEHEIPQPFSGQRVGSRHIEDSFAVLRNRNLPVFYD